MRFGEVAVEDARGAILAHSVKTEGVNLKKGTTLGADEVAKLEAAGVDRVTVAVLEEGDVEENAAALRLAEALKGEAMKLADTRTGRVNLHAAEPGLALIDRERLDRINEVDEAITVGTLADMTRAEKGQMLATVKIIPFAAPGNALEAAIDIAREAPVVRLAPFRPKRARLIQTMLPETRAKMLDKTRAITAGRMEAVGGSLVGETRCPHDAGALEAEIAKARAAGLDMLLIAGASAIQDRGDLLPRAIEAEGGRVHHFGMPVDPGNLLLLGELEGRPVIGLPGCARSPKESGFDWVLARLAAGIEVESRDIKRMGMGGLLTEIPSRPQPREQSRRGSGLPPRVAVVILAAGQSRRMGRRNKLLIEVEGEPMLRRTVETALNAKTDPVVVVTGHQHEEVERTLAGLPVTVVHNPDYAEGLSASLKTGIAALGDNVDGALIMLADMPAITPELCNALVDAFDPEAGRSIVLPTHDGKRGNPVLWGRQYFAAMAELKGDVGARHLLGEHEEAVVEVECDTPAVLLDIDTPEALARFEGEAEGAAS